MPSVFGTFIWLLLGLYDCSGIRLHTKPRKNNTTISFAYPDLIDRESMLALESMSTFASEEIPAVPGDLQSIINLEKPHQGSLKKPATNSFETQPADSYLRGQVSPTKPATRTIEVQTDQSYLRDQHAAGNAEPKVRRQLSWLQREAWPCSDAAEAAARGNMTTALSYSWADFNFWRNTALDEDEPPPGGHGKVMIVDAFSSRGGQHMKLAVKMLLPKPAMELHIMQFMSQDQAASSNVSEVLFEREAEALKTLQTNPPLEGVPGFVWFGRSNVDDRLILVQEFVPGKDFLDHLLEGPRAVSRAQLATFLKRLMPTLEYMHKIQRILHLDIKLENVRGQDFPGCSDVKLLDYGLARPQPWDKRLPGEPEGTVAYMGMGKLREVFHSTLEFHEPICALEDLEQLLFTAICISSTEAFAANTYYDTTFPFGETQVYNDKWHILTASSVDEFQRILSYHKGDNIEKETLDLLFTFQQEIQKSRKSNGEDFDYSCSWIA